MRTVIINGIMYSCPDSWAEITLAQMEQLAALAEELPEKVEEHYRALVAGEANNAGAAANPTNPGDTTITSEATTTNAADSPGDTVSTLLLPAYRDMLGILLGVGGEVTDRLLHTDLEMLSRNLLDPILITVLISPVYEPTGLEMFEHRGEIHHLPKDGVDVMGGVMPLAGVSAREMCEASDVSMDANFRLGSLVTAILCRPEGEAYDEETAKHRNRIFKQLPAYVFMEVFSRMNKAHAYLAEEYPLCYGMNENGGAVRGNGKKTSWSDRLLFVADDKPSELPIVERMPFYDFMRLLNGKVKRQREQCQAK